jgi:hypothetical protein
VQNESLCKLYSAWEDGMHSPQRHRGHKGHRGEIIDQVHAALQQVVLDDKFLSVGFEDSLLEPPKITTDFPVSTNVGHVMREIAT